MECDLKYTCSSLTLCKNLRAQTGTCPASASSNSRCGIGAGLNLEPNRTTQRSCGFYLYRSHLQVRKEIALWQRVRSSETHHSTPTAQSNPEHDLSSCDSSINPRRPLAVTGRLYIDGYLGRRTTSPEGLENLRQVSPFVHPWPRHFRPGKGSVECSGSQTCTRDAEV